MANNLRYDLYLLNVPFNSDYKHVVYYANATQQFNSLITKKVAEFSNVNIIVKNSSFIIKGRNINFNNCNYIMYKPEDSTKWIYAFVDEVIYSSFMGTKIYHTIDVWQTYHTDAVFKSAFIERAHLNNLSEKYFENTLPEPFNFSKIISKTIADANTNFKNDSSLTFSKVLAPYYVMHCLGHIPNTVLDDSPLVIADNDLIGGCLTHACYGSTNPHNLESTLNQFANAIQTTPILDLPVMYRDARYAFEYCNIVPRFTLGMNNRDNLEFTDATQPMNMWGVVYENYLKYPTSLFVHFGVGKQMACGYTPRNKKLYNSNFQVLSINTPNGLHCELDMSLFKNYEDAQQHTVTIFDDLELILYGSLGGNGDYYINLPHYENATQSENFIRVSYGGAVSLGYDQSNSGEYRQQRQINAVKSIASAGISLASAFTGIGIARQALTSGSGTDLTEKEVRNIDTGLTKLDYQTDFNIIKSGKSGIDTYTDYLNQEASQSKLLKSGNNTDITDIALGTYKLTIELNSIRKKEAEIIDDYLDRYGYNISEYGNISTYMHTRPIWNYIQTKEAVIDIPAPENDIRKFNEIFNNGTTVWHSLNRVGIYGTDNYNTP